MESPASILRRHGLSAKKSWGQCFLHDPAVIQRIAEAADLSMEEAAEETTAEKAEETAGEIVVEIGAGLGALTHALAARAGRVICIERDRDMVRVLREEFASQPQVEIREENALTFDFSQFGSPVPVVGNLPYNISSPLIFHLLDQRQHIRSATLMLQSEVAARIVADPGTKAYGVPSVLCQQVAEARLCFGVSSGAFTPRPRVESAVIQLQMRAQPLVEAEEPLFTRVVKAAFQYRRKTLKRALGQTFPAAAVQEALAQANIDGTRRGETLTIEEYGILTRALSAIGSDCDLT